MRSHAIRIKMTAMSYTSLSGKTFIVTGAGQGIGLAIAQKLIESGSRVVINDSQERLLGEALASLNTKTRSAAGICGDASEPAVINELIRAAVEFSGRLDGAVANAGITLFGDFFSYQPADFESVLLTNLRSAFFLTQGVANHLRQQHTGGSILLMSSVTAHQAHRDLAAYAMTKAATEMLARNLVLELSPSGIRINAIAPGATRTERTLSDPEYNAAWSALTPLGKPADTDDIASTAAFLLSHDARHITGQTIVVDGGWTAVSPNPS